MCKGKVNWQERIKIGQKFNRLSVLDLPDELKWNTKILCRCDCGKLLDYFNYDYDSKEGGDIIND